MSYQPFRGGTNLRSGAVAGAATYLLGVVLIYHAGIHLPGWGGTLRGAVLVYTVVWIYLLVARRRGVAAASRQGPQSLLAISPPPSPLC